jgi:acyl-CoA thioester hydrolase
MYEKTLYAGWGDMDFNAHMRNTSYLDKAADVRMIFFAEHGFTMRDFVRLRIGPVILRDDVEYAREVGLLEQVKVTLALAGLDEDGSRWMIRNEFYRDDGKLAARVTSTGAWLDLAARRTVIPPDSLLSALRELPRTGDFQDLSAGTRSPAQREPPAPER